jgi:hypothetical protein
MAIDRYQRPREFHKYFNRTDKHQSLSSKISLKDMSMKDKNSAAGYIQEFYIIQ